MGRLVEIYSLADPRTGDIRYIGKALDSQKRYKGHLRDSGRRKTPVYRWIAKLLNLGMRPALRVLLTCHHTEWQSEERRLIAEYRLKGTLLNVADGGDEPKCSHETRSSNAKSFNSDRGLTAYREMMRQGSNVVSAWLGRQDKTERLAELQRSLGVIRSFTREQKIKAGIAWQGGR